MKLFYKAMCLLVFAVFTLGSCTSMASFSDITEKEWFLSEIRANKTKIIIDRNELKNSGFGGDIFSLVFNAGRVSGMGAPNRYFAPYTLGEKQAITIQNIAGTLMAPLFEPEKLKEHEFFAYLQNAYKWDLVKGQLELYTKGENNIETVLVFRQ